jgi:hypothetical protein
VTSTDGDGAAYRSGLILIPVIPPNESIANAIPLSSDLPSVRNQGEDIYSATATDSTRFHGNTSGANVWYSWRAPANGLVRIRAIAPTATAGTGNFPTGTASNSMPKSISTRAIRRDLLFDTTTAQNIAGFDEGTNPQEDTFYAIKDVVYFIEIGGDANQNPAGARILRLRH